MDILNLPGWTVLDVQEAPHLYHITAEVCASLCACPWCGSHQPPYRFGIREYIIVDLPIHGRQVQILARRQRYRCRQCRHTFLDPLLHINEHHAVTERLMCYVEREALSLSSRTFVSLAREVGLTESSVRNLFDTCVKKREQARCLMAPDER